MTPTAASCRAEIRFASGYLDTTGYYKFGERYYDPALARWTEQAGVSTNSGDRVTSAPSTTAAPASNTLTVGPTVYTQSILGVGAQTTAGVSTYFTREPNGRLMHLRDAATTLYYLTDGHGALVGLTDTTGRVVATYAYEPFGAARTTTGIGELNPWRYAGGYLDTTGYYKFGGIASGTSSHRSRSGGRWAASPWVCRSVSPSGPPSV